MHANSLGRVRSRSAPARLATPIEAAIPDRLQCATVRFQRALDGARAHLAPELLHDLSQVAHHGGDLLRMDEMPSGAPSQDGETALDEVMAALNEVRAAHGTPLAAIALPAGLKRLPKWLAHFDGLQRLSVPHFRGRQLDARPMGGLLELDLGELMPREMTLRLPTACGLKVSHPDQRPPRKVAMPRADHVKLQLHWRALNFNGAVQRKEAPKENYFCRHLAIEKIRLWGEEPLRKAIGDAGEDPLTSRSGIAQVMGTDTEVLYLALDDHPCHADLVAHSQWGAFAEHQFAQMAQQGQGVAFAIMNTRYHVLALRFDASGPGAPRIECWDPNFANVSCISQAPFGFNALLQDPDRLTAPYFGQASEPMGTSLHTKIVFIADPLDPAGSIAGKPSGRRVSLAHADLPHAWHPELVRELVGHGFASRELQQHLIDFMAMKGLSAEDARTVLRGDSPSGFPALFAAAERGHPQPFRDMGAVLQVAFGKGLLKEPDVLKILAASCAGGQAMGRAFALGHHQVITAMGSTVLQLVNQGTLKPRAAYHLMRATNRDGNDLVHQIKDKRSAKALMKALKALRAHRAIEKEDFKELMEEVEERLHTLRQDARTRRAPAAAALKHDPSSRV